MAVLATELRTLIGRLKRKWRESLPTPLNLSQTSVLSRLDREGPTTVSALARAEKMRPQSMGAHVATLEQAGLVRGQPDPSDRRQTLIAATDQGRTFLATMRAAGDDWLAHAIHQRLSADEQAQIAAAVPLLQRLAD